MLWNDRNTYESLPSDRQTHLEVALLGSTGTVAQKLIALINKAGLPIVVRELVASDLNIGKRFAEACKWREVLCDPPSTLLETKLIHWDEVMSTIVFSCLPDGIASEVEPKLVQKGKIVFSNSSVFRLDAHVPLMMQDVNPWQIAMLEQQPTPGKLLKNPNCSAAGIATALLPFRTAKQALVSIVTLQSVSGAGYPGISSMDVLNNTIPHIDQEAEKIEVEIKKILDVPSWVIRASTHRVPVIRGHTASIHMIFCSNSEARKWKDLTEEFYSTQETYQRYQTPDRPQSALDLTEDDMRVHVGPLRLENSCISFNILSHNLVRGAAGAALGNLHLYLKTFGTP